MPASLVLRGIEPDAMGSHHAQGNGKDDQDFRTGDQMVDRLESDPEQNDYGKQYDSISHKLSKIPGHSDHSIVYKNEVTREI